MLDDRPGRSCGKPPEKMTKESLDNVNRVSVYETGKSGSFKYENVFLFVFVFLNFTRWSMISIRLSGWLCIRVFLLDLLWLDK